MKAKKGDWVQVRVNVLAPGERAPQVPDDTKSVPLQLWTKGTALNDAEIGGEVEILTETGRRVTGVLTEAGPSFTHSFGSFLPEIIRVRAQLKELMQGGGRDE